MNLSSPEALAAESKSSDDPKFEFSDFSGNESVFFMPEEGQIENTDCSEFSDKKNGAKKAAVTTPDVRHPQFTISYSPITPFPDCNNMRTPEIRAALKRYGVKALPRKKVIKVLTYVYSETHPMMEMDGEMDSNNLQESTPKTSGKSKKNEQKKRRKLTEDYQKQTKKRQKENHQACNTVVSPESDDNKSDNPKWLECVPEMSFSQSTQDFPTKTTKEESVKEYMQSNIELYDNILSCKPLNLVELHQELKNNNVKLSCQKLKDFLDAQMDQTIFWCAQKLNDCKIM